MLDKSSRSTKLSMLYPDTKYLICVLALGNWVSWTPEMQEARLFAPSNTVSENSSQNDHNGNNHWEVFTDSMLPLLVDSPTSKCTEVNTLGVPDSIHGGLGSLPDQSIGVQSILTRRLGLIIGCCMGFVVFIVLVSVLGYLKVKKQRQAIKRDQPIPPEYISYRHFSIQSGETGTQHSGHPHFITSMNTTTLN